MTDDDKVTSLPPDLETAARVGVREWTRTVGTIRKGSRLAYWRPNGILQGIIEAHPDHPPRVHFLDGRGTQILYVHGATNDMLTVEQIDPRDFYKGPEDKP